jgi:Glycosyltransferase family 87
VLLAISIFLAACTAAVIGAGFTRNRIPVAVSVVTAAALRIAFALMTSQPYTPHDTRVYFRATGELVLRGREPLQNLPGREWNFLELMPYIHAAELKTGLPWVLAIKIAPIAADVVLVWIVSRLAGADGRTRALQYAVNPLSLMVASLHGQVEPVALALALGGVLVLRTRRPFLAGVLLGAAVAAKTWPVLILIAVLPGRAPKRAARILAGAAVVPVLCLASGALFLGTDIPRALSRVLSYSGYVQSWTWSAALWFSHPSVGGYRSSVSGLADALILAGVVVTLFLLRRRPPEARALGVLCAVLICTAGFGVQYLMWVLPLAMAISGIWRYGYLIAASAWAALAYIIPLSSLDARRFLSWLPAAMLVALIVEQVRGRSLATHQETTDNRMESGPPPQTLSPLHRERP